MIAVEQQTVDEYIEHLRSTGFHGREPWVPQLDRTLGTAIATLRQLEICTEQMACVWLDAEPNHMDNHQIWDFITDSFIPRLRCLVERLDQTISSVEAAPQSLADRRFMLVAFYSDTKLLFAGAIAGRAVPHDCGETVIPLLFATLMLQGLALQSADPHRFTSIRSTTKLAPVFLERCWEKLGWRPFGADMDTPIAELFHRFYKKPTAFKSREWARPTLGNALVFLGAGFLSWGVTYFPHREAWQDAAKGAALCFFGLCIAFSGLFIQFWPHWRK